MKTNTRYIITTAGIAAGLFAIGATANALSSDSTTTADPIGEAVVLPSASATPSASPSLVEVEYAEHTEPSESPVVLPDAGWTTGPGSAGDDDHDDVGDDHDDDDGDDD